MSLWFFIFRISCSLYIFCSMPRMPEYSRGRNSVGLFGGGGGGGGGVREKERERERKRERERERDNVCV